MTTNSGRFGHYGATAVIISAFDRLTFMDGGKGTYTVQMSSASLPTMGLLSQIEEKALRDYGIYVLLACLGSFSFPSLNVRLSGFGF